MVFNSEKWRKWFSIAVLLWWAWVAIDAYSRWWVCVEYEAIAHPCDVWQRPLWWALPPLALLGLVVWLAPLWHWLFARLPPK
jgi:hypothetical protein